ncbi:MAG: ABC transporter ATP-binding protein [Bacilli bacterium]|nr:ABC transporter ATP-binding protein [Bacilli bacterium]
MLKALHIVSGYNKGKDVIKDVSLTLNKGKIAILLGPNGSGKSTLIKSIVGIIKPKQCELSLFGKSLNTLRERSENIAYVPQNSSLPPLSVFDSVLMGRMPLFGFAPRKEDKEKTIEVLDKLGLLPFANKRADMLSGGEAQKVMVARALASEPKAIIFDEPTSNLDIQNQLLVVSSVKALAEEGLMVLIAMHDMNLALDLGDYFYCLKDGEILKEGEEDIIDATLLHSLYGVDAEISFANGHKHIHYKEVHI